MHLKEWCNSFILNVKIYNTLRTLSLATTETLMKTIRNQFLNIYQCELSCSVVSNSLRPHGLSHARLLSWWGFSRQECWSGLPFAFLKCAGDYIVLEVFSQEWEEQSSWKTIAFGIVVLSLSYTLQLPLNLFNIVTQENQNIFGSHSSIGGFEKSRLRSMKQNH